MTDTVKLVIGNKNYSSWSLRAWLLLREAGIEFEEQRIALDIESTAAALAAASPACRVPVLILGGETIWDTLAIAETVAERWPEKMLWPEDPETRAHARAVSAEMHAGFAALREAMPMNCRALGRKVPIPGALAVDIERIFEIWTDCRTRYASDGPWLFGSFSIADTMFAPVVMRFRTYGVDVPDVAGGYPVRLLQSAAMQQWLADGAAETEVIEQDEKGQ